jgi:hypothetical protein
MKARQFTLILLALALAMGLFPRGSSPPANASQRPATSPEVLARVTGVLRLAPLMFVENVGQFDPQVRFQARGRQGALHLTEDGVWYTLLAEAEAGRGVSLRMSFVAANPHPEVVGFSRLDTAVSYFTGNDPAKWQANVAAWGGVRYEDLYPGIDLEFTSADGRLVQRIVARRGADLSALRLRVEGADELTHAGEGLRLAMAGGDFTLPLLTLEGTMPKGKPEIFSVGRGTFEVTSPFVSPTVLDVSVQSSGAHDVYGLGYSTFLGGTGYDGGTGIAVDSSGAAYVIGAATSDFPTTPGAYDESQNGGTCSLGSYAYTCPDVVVSKLSADGTGLVYSTFIGGTGPDLGVGLFVDASGAAYVTGSTTSTDFPTTDGAYDDTCGTDGICDFDDPDDYSDAFVTKLNADGTDLTYSTFLGGSRGDSGASIGVDTSGAAYVTGVTSSPDFPATSGAYDESCGSDGTCDFDTERRYSDAFVTKLNADGTGLVYSTFVGGSHSEGGSGIALLAADGSAIAYVTGSTTSADFPTTEGAYDDFCGTAADCNFDGEDRRSDAFVTKLNAAGTGLDYSTFLGGSAGDSGSSLGLDSSGDAYVTGSTSSSDFPTTAGAFNTTHNGGSDVFVAKLNPASNGGADLSHSTFFGGSASDSGASIAPDASGAAHVTGSTTSSDLPTTPGAIDSSYHGGTCGIPPFVTWPCPDAFVVKVKATGIGLQYSTYLGGASDDAGTGIALDATGAVYLTGGTTSRDFPITEGAFQTTFAGGLDGYVTKLVPFTEQTYLPLVLRSYP